MLIGRRGQAGRIEVLLGIVRRLLVERLVLVATIHVGRKEQQAGNAATAPAKVLRGGVVALVGLVVVCPDMLDVEWVLDAAIDVAVEQVRLSGADVGVGRTCSTATSIAASR